MITTLEWVWWFNHDRLWEPIGYVSPVEHEEAFFRSQEILALLAVLNEISGILDAI